MKVRDVLYLVMSALRKLQAVEGVTLYRGIHEKADMSQYKDGSTVMWPGFSSTSPDMSVTKTFLAHTRSERNEMDSEEKSDGSEPIKVRGGNKKEGGEEVTLKGTLFIIEEAWGYNIQPYSLYSEEEEILLEPESVFEVTSVVDSDELTIVTLKMLDTSPILTKIFGENKQ